MKNIISKHIKLAVTFASLLFTFVISSVITNDVSAFNLGATGAVNVSGAYVKGNKGGSSVQFESYAPSLDSTYIISVTSRSGVETGTDITELYLDTGTGQYSGIPANTLFTFSLRFYTDSSNGAIGIGSFNSGGSWTLLNQNCFPQRTNNAGYASDIVCNFWGYTANGTGSDVGLSLLANWPYGTGYLFVSRYIGTVKILSESGSGSSGLTEAELNGSFRTWLNTKLTEIYNQGGNELTTLNQIQALLESQDSNSLEIKNSVNDLKALQAQQVEQEKEQYEAEKAEEAEREQAGQDSAGELGGTFNFSVTNPFTGILGMFTAGDGCVQIPVIAGMLGAEDTRYCPWFSPAVRNVLTPVIGMSSTILLFGFIVGWLKSNSFNGAIKE